MTFSNTQLAGTALVIDDQETLLTVAMDMLTAKGMDVLTAQSGQEGIRLYQEHAERIDVVLLDMKMPDLNGDEVFATLKAFDPEVRVIITTGFEEEETLAHFNGQLPIAFIQKPYRFHNLVEMIASMMPKRQ